MPDTNDQNPLMQLQSALNSLAPHVVLQRIQESLIQKPPAPAAAPAGPSEAELALQRQYEEKPWTAPRHTERVVTDRKYDPRLTSYWKLNENLLGRDARSGQYVESRPERFAYLGLGDTVDSWGGEEPRGVNPPKAEAVPQGLPFASDRKSGEQYWKESEKKPIETLFF